MAGSALAGRLLAPSLNIRVERYMQAVFAASALALFVPVIFNRTKAVNEADSLKADAPGWRLPLLACLSRLHIPMPRRSTNLTAWRMAPQGDWSCKPYGVHRSVKHKGATPEVWDDQLGGRMLLTALAALCRHVIPGADPVGGFLHV